MVFTSLGFIAFFAVCTAGYFIIPKKIRWVWLLAASVFFYFCAGVIHALFVVVCAIAVYIAGVILGKISSNLRNSLSADGLDKMARKKLKSTAKNKSIAVIICILALLLGTLWVIKYLDFTLQIISRFVPSYQATSFGFILPLGISFYIFISIGYLIDVYRGVCEPQKNPLKLLLFLSFFPCAAQGPISRYNELAPTLFEGHDFDYDRVTKGVQRMLWGFFEKLVIADRLAILVNGTYGDTANQSGAALAVATLLYAFQIYADFQGYMDIACGAASVMGITVPENFNSPYLSSSVPEFWRRWHITLGSWFRDYLYYPVMRCPLFNSISKKARGTRLQKFTETALTVVALLVVWTTTGVWHGASTAYISWGFYYGVLISLSLVFKPLFDRAVKLFNVKREGLSYGVFSVVKTFFLVCVGYIFFRSQSLAEAKLVLHKIFSTSGLLSVLSLNLTELGLDGKDLNIAVIAVALLIFTDVCRTKGVVIRNVISKQGLWLRWTIWLAGISAVVIFGIYGPGYDASSFIYFAF